ncbi:hypothetical protein DFJ74DRAFT_681999 [Hyaloraphidium curvatum]|nr:hypothetical protein DFJ74DRAFT_681999 [Hyaloraphidium curvatum]
MPATPSTTPTAPTTPATSTSTIPAGTPGRTGPASPTRESLPRSPLGTPSLPPASRLGLLPPVAPKDSFSFPRPSPARTDLPRRPSDPGRPRTVSFAEAVSCFETWGKDEYLRAKTPEQPDYGGGEEAEWEAAPLVPVLPTVHLPARAAPPPVQSPPNPKPRGLMPSLRNMLRV